MEPKEFETLFSLEDTYWWFRVLRGVVTDCLRSAGLREGSLILDAGCGTGGLLEEIGRRLTPDVCGFDVSSHAVASWGRRGLCRMCRASVNDLPYRQGAFDAVLSVDVLECDGVDDRRAFGEMWRVTKTGGILALIVPAYAWMRTEDHHRAVHASRRYSRFGLRRLLGTRPVRLLRVTHVFATVFPAIAAVRVASRCLLGRSSRVRSELFPLPGAANRGLVAAMGLERRILRRTNLPLGSSLLAVVRKERSG